MRIERVSLVRRVLDSSTLYRLIALGVFGGLWQLATLNHKSLLIPTFADTVAAIPDLLFGAQSSALWNAMYQSNIALVIGFAISIVLGIPLGLLIGRFHRIERFASLYLNILLVTPMAAIIPLLVMSLGIRDGAVPARVTLIVLFAIVMLIVNSRAGIRQVDPALIEMARCFGAGELSIWRRILIPSSIPAIMTGVRLGLGRAITGMVVIELLLIAVGLGSLIQRFEARFEGAHLYALIIIVVFEALILIQVVRWIERVVAPWRKMPTFGGGR
ncbi:MAG: ABC transporter permease subunit [Myxococcales bacterium]|nr:ABC transporter permease subunit [Myxococcales bacterium]